jgi:hypothetical protein
MFLTPSSNAGLLRFAIKNEGAEQAMTGPELVKFKWTHVVVTLGASEARMYVNGEMVAESNTITISPMDFKPVLNYIGRSQYPDPLLKGNVDDFRIYNYPLSADEVEQLAGAETGPDPVTDVLEVGERVLSLWPMPANDILQVNYFTEGNDISFAVYDVNGKLAISKYHDHAEGAALDISNLPSGLYILKVTNGSKTSVRKIIVTH